jgi:hypothetical protein
MPCATDSGNLITSIWQSANEAAFFERRNQPMDARFGAQVECILHLVE